MSFYKELDNCSLEQLISWWQSPLPPWADEDDENYDGSRSLFFSELAYAISGFTPYGIQFLKQFTHVADQVQRASALSALAWPATMDDKLENDLLAAFSEESEDLKTVALWGFIHCERFPLARDSIVALMELPGERIAALAMVYLSHAYPAEAIAILRRGLSDDNPYKRSYACDEVGDNDLIVLKDLIEQLRTDPVAVVQEAATSNYLILMNLPQ